MAVPRVFISSTCYDLKYIRENLKFFVRQIGFDPVLSEEGSVFYNPSQHTQDSCLVEVPNSQIFVLVIGGRYGGKYQASDHSITNEEYRTALKHKIPIFTLVEDAVYSDLFVYQRNKENRKVDQKGIIYPSLQGNNTKIFDFINEVRSQSINNALVPFKDFSDMEHYLKQQWAGMMFSFLANRNEEMRVSELMEQLIKMNERIEFLSNQVLKAVGSKESNAMVKLYDIMLNNPATKTLLATGYKPDPISILQSKTLMECSGKLGKPLKVEVNTEWISTASGEIEANHFVKMEEAYIELKKEMMDYLNSNAITIKQLVESQKTSA